MSTAPDLTALRRRIRANAALPCPDERRRLRVTAGLTQADLAAAAAVSVATISMWERGAREPTGTARDAYRRILAMLREETGRQVAA
jgi:DNA-binding transcriptional regulator YiaG